MDVYTGRRVLSRDVIAGLVLMAAWCMFARASVAAPYERPMERPGDRLRTTVADFPTALDTPTVHTTAYGPGFLQRTTTVTDPFVVPVGGHFASSPAPAASPSMYEFEMWDDGAVYAPVATTSWSRPNVRAGLPTFFEPTVDAWKFQCLPDGLIYRSYLAGMNEPGLRSMWVQDYSWGGMWDISLGGRAGIWRYGTLDSVRPEGWQMDIEGAALLRLDLEHERDVMATDYRFGIPLTWGNERWQVKLAYYHVSSHLGDEYMLRFPDEHRINYVRDSIVLGLAWTPNDYLRFYGEAAWAYYTGEKTEPWEFQFGAEYSHLRPDTWFGSPFFAINGHLRQENDFGGGLTVQTGWQWRGHSGHLFRTGMQFYSGQSDQFSFYDRYERKIGFGVWYDF